MPFASLSYLLLCRSSALFFQRLPCLLFSCSRVNWLSFVSFPCFLSLFLFLPEFSSPFCDYICVLWRKDEGMSDRFGLGPLLLPCIKCKQIKTAKSLLQHTLSITIDSVSGPRWVQHSGMWTIWLRLFLPAFLPPLAILHFHPSCKPEEPILLKFPLSISDKRGEL